MTSSNDVLAASGMLDPSAATSAKGDTSKRSISLSLAPKAPANILSIADVQQQEVKLEVKLEGENAYPHPP